MTSRSPLRRLLQEQQEPFELEDYLCERDYSRKSLSRDSGFTCSSGKLDSIMKFGKGFAEINKMLRNSCKKLVSINRKQQIKDLGKNGWIFSVGCKRVAESDNFSSPCAPRKGNEETSSSTQRHRVNLSTSDTFKAPDPCNLQELKAAAGEKLVSRSMQPRKQSQLHKGISLQKKVPEDSILSATLWELLLYTAETEKTSGVETAELQELVASNPASSQLLISKRVIHQTKQLLFECVREVVESHSKLICKKQATGEEANLSNLLNSDYLVSVAEWRDLKLQKQLIETEIGELILQEITNEVVIELIHNL